MKLRTGGVVVGFLLFVLSLAAQTASSSSTSSQVPPLIPFSSFASDEGGSSLSGVVSITFSLYTAQQGGAPLWAETQNNVQLDSTGHYSVQLGITKPNGVPTTLFTTGEARWLGVRIAEQEEQPRVLLLSVPYALKAGDAATIGGLPPSAFVLAAPLSGTASASGVEPTNGQGGPPPAGDVTGTGTVNFLPLWDSTSDITSSVLFQKGTGSTAKIGINTITPATTLDVKGAGTIRGTLSLPAAGTATATKGANSQPLNLAASAFNSTSSTAVNQTFQWQSEPAGNDTSTPSGTLNLLFGEGATKPSETGFHIASNGQITFATGQTFPGTGNGTITGITTASGSGLTGGGNSGTLSLGLLTTCTTKQVLQWSGSAWACASAGAGTVTSVGTGLGLKGGPITNTGTLTIDTNVVPQLSAANTFNANQTVFGTLTVNAGNLGLSATAASTNGVAVLGVSSASTGDGAGIEGQTYAPSGQGVYGINLATTGSAPGVFGTTQSTAGYGVQGENFAQTGVAVGVYGYTQSPAGYGVEGVANSVGTAGFFQANGGNILQGNNGSHSEFVVTSAGVVNANAVIAAGAVSAGSSLQISGQPFAYGSYANQTTFLGFGSGPNATGIFDIGIGFNTLPQDTGGNNTAIGVATLFNNTAGTYNTAVGNNAGVTNDSSNLTGGSNTALGAYAFFGTGSLQNATAIGANALVSESNALVLGATGTNVGIGTSTPGATLEVDGPNQIDVLIQAPESGIGAGLDLNTTGSGGLHWEILDTGSASGQGANKLNIRNVNSSTDILTILADGNVGIGTTAADNTLTVNGSADKPGGGSWGTYSDGRLKTVNGGFTPGLSQVMKIHPVHYRYKADNAMGIRDTGEHIGVVAQDVQKVIPEAVTENSKGYLLVNNDPILWTMLNAIKEQQREIKKQQSLLRAQTASMQRLQAEVRETRESLRKVKAQAAAVQPALIATK